MKKVFQAPVAQVVKFNAPDVICTSTPVEPTVLANNGGNNIGTQDYADLLG
ncbi:MAG: hypothetical protein IJC89_02755 [Clostridia bacterium]|nr:hypothetical protein [Clostridia bacterium]